MTRRVKDESSHIGYATISSRSTGLWSGRPEAKAKAAAEARTTRTRTEVNQTEVRGLRYLGLATSVPRPPDSVPRSLDLGTSSSGLRYLGLSTSVPYL